MDLQDAIAALDLVLPIDPERAGSHATAPRLKTLDGKRIVLMDNRKGNANVLLERIAKRLAERHQLAGYALESKFMFSRPAAPEVVHRLAAQADAVITAIGD